MIPFACPCGKTVAVQDTLAGKMVKCPACGRTALAPQPSLAPSRPGQQADPPQGLPTISSPEGRSRSSSNDETVGAHPGRADLTSFLAPAQQPDELGRLGVFRVLKVLGQGGMGAVFLAEDPKLRRKVALKVMLPELARSENSRQRFLREAQAAASLEHDFIVPILHIGEDGGVPYIVMPFLRGMPLADHLVKDQPLPIPEIVKIGREMAEALAAAHDHGMVHRDIKPGNIWLEDRGQESGVRSQATGFRVKLLDFGLAHLAVVEDQEHLTRTGALLGTPGYMSPEQVDGQLLDGRSDLFSLGCVLYRLATGQPAYAGTTMTDKIVALATASPPPPHRVNAEVPIAMSQLIQELLAKTPDQRPANATAVASRLAAIERAMAPPPEKTADIPIAAPVSRHRRNRLLVALAVAIVVIGGGLLTMQQIRITTPKGTLVIDTDDPNVEVVVKKNGAVLRDKLKDREILLEVGDYTIELTEKKDGLKLSTNKFSIIRDGTETVTVCLEKPPPGKGAGPEPVPVDLDRKMAEWALKHDGGIRVYLEPGGWINRGAKLPDGDFRCTSIGCDLTSPEALPAHVASSLKVLPMQEVLFVLSGTDWGDDQLGRLVAKLRDVRNLHLWMDEISPLPLTDKGLKHLLQLTGLKGIKITAQKCSDEGIRELHKLPPLECIEFLAVPISDKTVEALVTHGKCRQLGVNFTWATDACLPAILKNADLEELGLFGIPLRGEDLRKLAGLKKLQTLGICGPHITNESVRLLEPLPALYLLRLRECERIDEAVFEHLGKLKNLTRLGLTGNAKITDAALAKVKNLPNLQLLALSEMPNITADGVKKLRAALPKLQIEWDGDAKK